MSKTIVFTDLDGTLLDAKTYSFREALPALDMLQKRRIPLILCSSKTRAEMEACRHHLNNGHPFISENGGGIFIPSGYFSFPIEAEAVNGYQVITLGMPYADIKSRFAHLRKQIPAPVRGFADMPAEEIAALTGLPLPEAMLAKQRDFDEPFIFRGEPDQRFLQAIESMGLRWTQGRIFHIMGHHDKGRAVKLLTSLYERQYGPITSIGLGDGYNDLPMLQAVNHPVLVRHEDGSFEARIDIPGLLKTQLPGPAGWNETLLRLLPDEKGEAEIPARTGAHENSCEIFNAALSAVDPCNAVRNAVKIEGNCLYVAGAPCDLAAFHRILVIGAGKAAARMALAIETVLAGRIDAGLVIVKQGHTIPLKVIEQVEASHPVPDAAGLEGARRILDMVRAADEKTLVLCLLSGGASALLVSPVNGVTLQDKQQVTGLLLNAGASIGELNAVRKHLSAIKGGRLAQAAYPARMVTMILSDVIGDRLDVIASGPTAPDVTRFDYAWQVIEKYGLEEKIPLHAKDYLQRGMAGQEPETVKAGDPCLDKGNNIIVGSIRLALDAAAEKSRQLGYATEIITAELQGEARDAARFMAQTVRDRLPGLQTDGRLCLLFGGETTVTVKGMGKGGRNQELALAFAMEIAGLESVSLLSAGTDGGDGPTDAAGAIVDGGTAAHARRLGIEPATYLDNNDSYNFFHRFDASSGQSSHFITGPTGTNVMDIQIVLLHGTRLTGKAEECIKQEGSIE
jgi:hydroxypyruvate reductase